MVDLAQILDTEADPQRWTMDVGRPSGGYKKSPGAVWRLTSSDQTEKQGQVGQFDAADLSGPLRAIEVTVQHISARSRTPQYLFQLTGSIPSGEALKTVESGFVGKIKQRQIDLGNSWEDVISFAARLEHTFGNTSKVSHPDDFIVETRWRDPETRNEDKFMAVLTAKSALGVSKKQIFRELSYTDDKIDDIMEELEEEKAAAANIGAALLQRFEQEGT
jgi:hypothetical protein